MVLQKPLVPVDATQSSRSGEEHDSGDDDKATERSISVVQTRSLQLLEQLQESTPTHGLFQAAPKSPLLSKHDWDSRTTPEVTMISGSIILVLN